MKYCKVITRGRSCFTLNHVASQYERGLITQGEADKRVLHICKDCPEYVESLRKPKPSLN